MSEVRAKKALGQHFLTDLNIARKICDSLTERAEGEPEAVLEVGCGMGVLTQYLLQRGDITTYGAEIDSESVEYLNAHYPEFTPRLIEGDFLKMDLRERFAEGVRVIGNFPYNISSQNFFKIIKTIGVIRSQVNIYLTFQAVCRRDGPDLYHIKHISFASLDNFYSDFLICLG